LEILTLLSSMPAASNVYRRHGIRRYSTPSESHIVQNDRNFYKHSNPPGSGINKKAVSLFRMTAFAYLLY
jgi:hypothetical protein